MKNRDKYREEIVDIDAIPNDEFCDKFIVEKILKPLGLATNTTDCVKVGCDRCVMIQQLWLDDEYKEPEDNLDPKALSVDDVIQVSNGGAYWFVRHFAKYEDGKIWTWQDGRSSKTAPSSSAIENWDHAKACNNGWGD